MPCVLLVDDEPTNLKVLQHFLASDNYTLITASDGGAALDLVRKQPPDLVLLDLSMPGLDGFTVLERLKSNDVTRLVPVVVVTGSAEREARLHAVELGADDFLAKPVDRLELRARVRALLRLKQSVDELERTENVLLAFARSIEARDPNTRDHCDRLADGVLALGREFGLAAERLRILRLGAYLHDVGKIGIPDTILLKPALLTPAERSAVRIHPVVGEEILRPLRTMEGVLPLVRHHHERLDGSGYPDGLQGDAISLEVRILSVADVFDALTTRRPYREALPVGEALSILRDEVGRGYWDSDVVAAASRVLVGAGR